MIENRVLELLHKAGLDGTFNKFNRDIDDQFSEQLLEQEMMSEKHRKNAKIEKRKKRREKAEMKRLAIVDKFDEAKIYERTRSQVDDLSSVFSSRFRSMSPSLMKQQKKNMQGMLKAHQSSVDSLLENCAQAINNPVILPEQTIEEENKAIKEKVQNIEKMMDIIEVKHSTYEGDPLHLLDELEAT